MPSNPFLVLDPDPYEPLELRLDIRIFTLQPARSWGDPIKCQLRVVSLDKIDGRYYEAVSYCWGDDEKSNVIELNQRPFYITDNLNDFLRYRRDKNQSVTLWIDAICINQNDLEEKRKQVQLMRDIFLCSDRLTVWLGPPSEDAKLAFSTMYYILQGDEFKLPYLREDLRLALTSLLDRPWWTRMWIVQEFILGTLFSKKSAAILQCGNLIFPMPEFFEVIERISNYQHEFRQHFPSIQKIVTLKMLRKSVAGPAGVQILKQLLSGRSSDSAPSLLELMVNYREHKASDARDKIYGFLGISQTEDDFFRSIIVDYEVSICELYRKAASFSITQRGDLDILKHCRGQIHKGLPSWVPDWSYFRKGDSLDDFNLLDGRSASPQGETLFAESIGTVDVRAEQTSIADGVTTASINTDTAPAIHKNRESLLAKLQNTHLHSVRSDTSQSLCSLSIEGSVLRTNAVVLDALKIVHAPFPDEIEVNWEACTELMVAVGRCKYSAFHQTGQERSPYSGSSGKETSFWAAIFGCDLYGENAKFRSMIESNHKKWLHNIPESWQAKEPRVTVLSSGLLSLAVAAASVEDLVVKLGQGMQFNLLPRDWDEQKIAFFQRRFNILGRTWETQPYDLRSRPFFLPNVVPDPYLESRPTEYHNPSKLDDGYRTQSENAPREDEEELLDRIFLCDPKGDIGRVSYGAALGRSFFITSDGYMGLAPPDAQSGDYVLLLDGAKFPFILRKVGSGEHTYRLIGESFMENLIDTELIEERCRDFSVERIAIV